MSIRFLSVTVIAAACALAVVSPALSQSQPEPEPQPHGKGWVQPPSELPKKHFGDKMHDLDFLFGALKVAPDEASAKVIEQHIWAQWLVSKSDTTNLLMSRVKKAVEAKDLDVALRLLDAVVELNPTYVEGWNRRATLHYMRKEFGQSLTDIRRVLALEPRHFGALTGLGLILREIGDDKDALEAFRKALAIDPHLEHIPDTVKTLTEKVDGRDL
jgi:tetratricopeptide (TPR) repeat protein